MIGSFRLQAERRVQTLATYKPPTPEEFERVQFELLKLFDGCQTNLPKGWDSYERFERIVMTLDWKSSPGWPLCKEATTIGNWLGGNPMNPDPYRMRTLWTMVQDILYEHSGDLDHIFKMFIKFEPHTKKKAKEGRWRLIMMSSLPVQIAWHMAVRHSERKFLSETSHPLKHGLVYYGGGWKRFHRENQLTQRYWAADKSGWDWNSPGWVYDQCRQLRKNLTLNSDSKWTTLMDKLYADAYENSVFVLPNGELYKQQTRGLMKSGLVVTISDNGISQLCLDILARLRTGMPDMRVIATGDDTLQMVPPNPAVYVSELQKAGCIIKETQEVEEFMGFLIDSEGFYPRYLGKHLMNLLYQDTKYLEETIDGYLRIYVYDDEMYNFFVEVARFLDFSVRPKAYYRYFAEHPDALEANANTGFIDSYKGINVIG